MSPPWCEIAELQARSEHDPEEHQGLRFEELTDDQREQAIETVLDRWAYEAHLGEPNGMLGR